MRCLRMRLKQRNYATSKKPDMAIIPPDQLRQQMSEVLSLREKVAQAELAIFAVAAALKEKMKNETD